ncbi:MAG: 4-alpha-glucanotransferase, partial [Trueperaceae bacterium]|nr:4-alpha-glucanotransferase [Trueperaceae bacterium]
MSRRAGLLLHPTSLPGPHGVGSLGDDAHAFVDWLADAGLRAWQILPLGPTGYGDSPYQAFSAFAGNPLLISLRRLARDGLLDDAELAAAEPPPDAGPDVDYGAVLTRKGAALAAATARLQEPAFAGARAEVERFRADQADWIEDYALFRALKDAHGGASWAEWPAPLRDRDADALAAARRTHAGAVDHHVALQAWFWRQWHDLRAHAQARDVAIIGDLPIFVAYDSADVWTHRAIFDLAPDGTPRVVAGVPPDYFSATGQRWGNPLYRWDVLAADGYGWWIDRLRAAFAHLDAVRIDHFRGFAAHWEIPADAPTAESGRWVEGPGQALFDAAREALGPLPILAEDLGIVTPDVEALRDANGFPGMKVLQFAFGGNARDPYLPHEHVRNAVVYTGTHDNDTTRGWFDAAPDPERDRVRRYLACSDADAVAALRRAAFASVADLAVVPMQDVLELGSEARMNTPGAAAGNWGWRVTWDALSDARRAMLRDLVELYGRGGDAADAPD